MSETMILSFGQRGVPILAYQLGTGNGIPRNVAEGILVDGIPVSEIEHVVIIIEPIPVAAEGCRESQNPYGFDDRKYSLQAVLKRSGENDECLFAEKVDYVSTLAFDLHDSAWLSAQLMMAVERFEDMGVDEKNF